jgi:UDP-N-acetylmuramate--L-alanine ligase/undecaprenyldiphospho-muramoylpentapeptide beta-N-acetylglucosaminyltransferase
MILAMPNVVIAAGGTAGHVVPAIAVADELRAAGAGVTFVGTRDRAEAALVPAAGYEISFLEVSGLSRSNPLHAARAAAQAAAALPAARRLLRDKDADVVLGGGGYVAGPVGLAATRMHIPLVLTEADSHLGIANRMLARFARRVCLAFPLDGREGERYLVTGRPVPRAILDANRDAARERLGIPRGELALLIFGGSLGARSLNEIAVEAFARAGAPHVLHIAGQRDFDDVASRLNALGWPSHYRLFPYLESIAEPLAASDLVLARAGGSVFEIAAAGKPAILVPYPQATAGHQDANARWMAAAGAATVVKDAELNAGRVRAMVDELLRDRDRLARMSSAAAAAARPDAAKVVAGEVLQAAGQAGDRKPETGDGDSPWRGRRLHFMGIGGAGMSGLALIAQRLGADVSGCDRAESGYLKELRDAGIGPLIGHDPAHIEPGLELVVSTAIPADHPEVAAARAAGVPVLHRTELLAEAARLKRVIAISGTHGKTTATAMTTHVLASAGMDPGYAIGAELRGRPNAAWGDGEWLVLEADESDRSFLRFEPEIAVVTNVEIDHHTTYSSLGALETAFDEFLALIPEDGRAIVWERLPLRFRSGARTVSYGIEAAELAATGVRTAGGGSEFTVRVDGRDVAAVRLPVPGEHNVLNALAALGAAAAAGCDVARGAEALSSFQPAGRRFEYRGTRGGAAIYDDYAHHPTEVEATLKAARALEPGRLIAAFQPHLYSRTLHMHREFGRALALADEVVVLDVYAAREKPEGPYAGVTGKLVADATADRAGGRQVWWLPEIDAAARVMGNRLSEGDLLVTMGAGDVDGLAARLVDGS